ncbi:MAG: type transport system permease protein [Blastocatellia bacterium]|jgi:ABC-2 type transport system permease protein|nr:type transport system permease protein [Blastocatellia bacterium]
MRKFLAVVKREYLQRVRTKMFIIMTILGPVIMVVLTVVPAMLFTMKAGEATRVAVIDQSGKLYERVAESIMRGDDRKEASGDKNFEKNFNSNAQERVKGAGAMMKSNYDVRQALPGNRSLDEVKKELNEQVLKDQLDGYIILPPDVLENGKVESHWRNVSDVVTRGQIEDRLSRAVVAQRMAEANIDVARVDQMSKPVEMSAQKVTEGGSEKDSGGGFYLVLAIGILILIMITTYGQIILAAVVEEKETRIAEVLFSSMRAFPLMLGKLIGVSLLALTQYVIWAITFALFALYGVGAFSARGADISLPSLPVSFYVYFFLFFILGYFIYATLYALIGSMVTTTQEGGQVALPVIFLIMAGYYLMFPVVRAPNSGFAFWVSMIPFFSPITMLVRIVSQTPPFWQIALSLAIGFGTVVLLIWLASRIYRVGMLMYGKRASIPEVVRWVRQA